MTGKLLLVVEDDVDTLQACEMLFRSRGHEVEGAADGLAALFKALALRPDLVVLDLGLPLMDGLDVLRRLRMQIIRRIPVLVLTGRAAHDVATAARREGADDVMISTVEGPTVVGEMSLITERPHSATVRARTVCAFQLLTRSQFDRLLKSESLAAYKLVATLADVIAGRLTRMDEKFAELARRSADAPYAEEVAAFRHKLFGEWKI